MAREGDLEHGGSGHFHKIEMKRFRRQNLLEAASFLKIFVFENILPVRISKVLRIVMQLLHAPCRTTLHILVALLATAAAALAAVVVALLATAAAGVASCHYGIADHSRYPA
jgi:alkylhydroperoxidase family enzyme